jgi:hypothetical protein
LANQGLRSLDYQIPKIDLSSTTGTAGISTLPNAAASSSPGFLSNLTSGNLGAAGSDILNYAKANPITTIGGALALTGAMGGFKPEQPPPPDLLERTPEGKVATGETYIANDPNKYIVQNLPGVNYTPEGGINYANLPTSVNGQPFNTVAPTMTYGSNQPRVVNNPYVFGQAYNFLPGNNQPRALAMGGPVYPSGTGIMALRKGGNAQYPRRTGQIQGPGTEKSDDIPAMLSDGEFVVTAKAVRGVGNGSRREGAKKLYRMMHAMEKKAGGKV